MLISDIAMVFIVITLLIIVILVYCMMIGDGIELDKRKVHNTFIKVLFAIISIIVLYKCLSSLELFSCYLLK